MTIESMVLTSGAFDGLHAGHVAYLEAARVLCSHPDELLVCAVAPDRYIADAKGRPAGWSQQDRMRTVLALGMVDAVLKQVAGSVASLITEHRPRLFVKGNDWQGRLPEDVYLACASVGTAVAFVESPGTHSAEVWRRHHADEDEAALGRLQAVMHGQTPASAHWTPVTDYSLEARRAIEGEHPRLIKETFAPSSIIDVGCGPGQALARLLREQGLVVLAVDRNDEHGGSTLDITKPINSALRADLVICREVLEHLTVREMTAAVRNLCCLSDTFVYVTTRFAKAPQHVFDVDTSDDLDPTHITMLTQPMLRALFVLQGMRRRADLEARLDWQKKGRVLVYEHVVLL